VTGNEQRIDALTDGERGMLIRELAESHPRITKLLLDRIDEGRQRAAAREAMSPHPFTAHPSVEGMSLCYFHDGATCLRAAGDPLHTPGGPS
jgi:hypothetical protein